METAIDINQIPSDDLKYDFGDWHFRPPSELSALKFDLFDVFDTVLLSGATSNTSSTGVVRLLTDDFDSEYTLPLQKVKRLGRVKVTISSVSKLSPPTI